MPAPDHEGHCLSRIAVEDFCEPELAEWYLMANLSRLQAALDELEARRIAVPPFEARHLGRGHAIHFRCSQPEVRDVRVDIMSRMRGVAPFPEL